MSLRPSNLGCALALAVGVGGLLVASPLPAAGPPGPPPGNPIKFSSVSQTGTNFNQFNPRQDGMKQLEEELHKSIHPFSHDSLSGLPAPEMRAPSRVVIPNKKTQEMLERRRNWWLQSPDDLMSGPTAEDIMGVPVFDKDGKLQSKRSPLENFLFPESPKAQAKDNDPPTGEPRTESDVASPDSEDATVPDNVKASQKELREKLASNPSALEANPARNNLTDIFGLGNKLPLAADPVEKARQEEWRSRWIAPNSSLGGDIGGQNPFASMFKPPPSPFLTMTPPKTPELPALAPREVSSPLSGATLKPFQGNGPDLTARAFSSYDALNSSLPLPKTEPPKLAPPIPTFSAPRRGF